jgi:lipoyl synthase
MASRRFPPWIRTRLGLTESLGKIHRETYGRGLHTVCKEALCPNQGECSRRGTATFMILGDRCTRNCSFCAVGHGQPAAIQEDESLLVAESVKSLGLDHAVITSVTRDDLPDGGASVFAETVRAIRIMSPSCTIEVLVPDFQGCPHALAKVIDSAPDVINHNVETVSRLYAQLRHGASYERSLTLLRQVADQGPGIVTKSGSPK